MAADHRIVLLVGDQLTDFDQVFRERGEDLGWGMLEEHREALHGRFVLVPNATYGYWRDGITGRGTVPSSRNGSSAFGGKDASA